MAWLSFAFAALGLFANLVPAGMYMYLHRGWKDNIFAKLLIPNMLAEGVLFVWLAIVRLLPPGDYRGWTSLAFYGVAVGVMVQRAIAYIREELKLGKELKRAENHVGLDQRTIDLQSDAEPGDGSGVR